MNTTCAEVRATLSAWLDGAASSREARSIDAHLADCPGCGVERAALERTRALIATAGRLRAPGIWRREAIHMTATARAGRRGAAPRSGPTSWNGALWARPAAFSSAAAAAVLVGISLYLFLPRGSVVEPTGSGAENELAMRVTKEKSAPAERVVSPEAQRADQAPLVDPPGSRARQAMERAPKNEDRPTAREESRDDEKAESPSVAKTLAPPGAIATGFTPVPAEAIARREMDALQDEMKVAAPAPPEPRAQHITLAQIRFPAAQGIDKLMSTVPRIAAEPTAAHLPKSAVAALARRPNLVRVLAVVDPEGRVLSARAAEKDPPPQAAALIERLIGATIDSAALPAPGPGPRDMVLEIELEAPANP